MKNMTFEQFKELPNEEKAEVLQSLAEKYMRNGKPYFPAMATDLGGSVVYISDLYKKLISNKSTSIAGDIPEKKEKPSASTKKESKTITQTKKGKRGRKSEFEKAQVVIPTLTVTEESIPEPVPMKEILPQKPATETLKNEPVIKGFEINMDFAYNGEEAIERISGLASSLYRNARYQVKIHIEEI